jgi:manganese transport protein
VPLFGEGSDLGWKILIVAGALFYASLLLFTIFYPLRKERAPHASADFHETPAPLTNLKAPAYRTIAVAMDFSSDDMKLLSHAIGQAGPETKIFLIHVVESPATRLMQGQTFDMETRRDMERLEHYALHLQQQGYQVSGMLGFNNRVQEIIRLVKNARADLLVIGSHGHRGIGDMVYGHTVDAVRHTLKIPMLIINL